MNNLALWTGSVVVYDPKGELPIILAARRGEGDEYCEGMEQDVFVLDPLERSGVDPKYLAYFDPLAGLDPKDGELSTWADRIANALTKAPEGTESAQWAKKAAGYIALIIKHVLTFDEYDEEARTLDTVLRLVRSGEVQLAEDFNRKITEEIKSAEREGRETAKTKEDLKNPYELMFAEMAANRALRGHIADEARSMQQLMKDNPRFFESVRGEAADQLRWIQSEGISRCLTGIDAFDEDGKPIYLPSSRRLDPDRVKTDSKGISVFIVMPVEDLDTYESWLQVVFVGLFAAMRKTKGKPKTGKQVLTILDEFSSLGHQEYIIKSLDSIAGSGMKLVTVVQNFGRLKELYKDSMESFMSNSGLEIYFGKIGQTAGDYLKNQLGETEVVRIARSQNRSETESETTGSSITFGESESEGGSESVTAGSSTSKSWNWNNSVNLSDSRNWGQSDGRNMGRNYGPHIFFEPFASSTSYGSNFSRNSGGSHTKSASSAKGGGKSYTTNKSKTSGSSWNRSTSKSETENQSTTKGYQIGGGIAETFHKKPLLEVHEINSFLQAFAEDDIDHPGYPGLMLVRMEGENPTFLRRCNYDQDPVFERCFTPDPGHEFLPSDEQPLLGYQYTDAHIWELSLTSELRSNTAIKTAAIPRLTQWFEDDDDVLEITHSDDRTARYPLGASGRIASISDQQERAKNGNILTARMARPISEQERKDFIERVFGADLEAFFDEQDQQRRKDEKQKADLAHEAQNRKKRFQKRLKIVGAIAATLLLGFITVPQIQKLVAERQRQAAEHAANIQTDTLKYVAAVNRRQEAIDAAKASRQLRIDQATQDRLARIEEAKNDRAVAIDAAIAERKQKIEAAINERQARIDAAITEREELIATAERERLAEQDRIDRDREALQTAIANRERALADFPNKVALMIEEGERDRRQAFQAALSERNRKFDDAWNSHLSRKEQETEKLVSQLNSAKEKLPEQLDRFKNQSKVRYTKDLRAAADAIIDRNNIVLSNYEYNTMFREFFDYENFRKLLAQNPTFDRSGDAQTAVEFIQAKLVHMILDSQRHPTNNPEQFNSVRSRIESHFNHIQNIEHSIENLEAAVLEVEEKSKSTELELAAKYPIPQLDDFPKDYLETIPEFNERDFPPVDESKFPLAKKPDVSPLDMSEFPPVDEASFPAIDMTKFPPVDMTQFPPVSEVDFPSVDLAQFPAVNEEDFPPVDMALFPLADGDVASELIDGQR